MELTNEFTVGVPVDQAWDVLTDVERIAPCMPGAQLQEVDGDQYRGVVKVKVGPITAQYKGAATFVEKDDDGHRAVLRAEGRETRGQGNASAMITATLVPSGDGTQVTVLTDLTVTGRVAQFGRGVLADVSAKLLGQFVSCLETTVLASGADADADADATDAGAVGGAQGAEGDGQGPAPADGAGDEGLTALGEAAGEEPAPARGAGGDAGGEGTAPAAEPPDPPVPPHAVTIDHSAPAAPAEPATATAPAEPATPVESRRIDHPEAEPVDLLGIAGAPVGRRLAPLLAALAAVLVFLRVRRRRR